jgi:hypothetical protein
MTQLFSALTQLMISILSTKAGYYACLFLFVLTLLRRDPLPFIDEIVFGLLTALAYQHQRTKSTPPPHANTIEGEYTRHS